MRHTRRLPHEYRGWSATDDGFARRYAVALVAGMYPDALAATRGCLTEFRRRKGYSFEHHVEGVRARIAHYAHLLGRPPASAAWSACELRTARRFARAALEGRCRSTVLAAKECTAALDRLARQRRVKTGRPVVRRSLEAVRGRLFLMVNALPGRLFGAR